MTARVGANNVRSCPLRWLRWRAQGCSRGVDHAGDRPRRGERGVGTGWPTPPSRPPRAGGAGLLKVTARPPRRPRFRGGRRVRNAARGGRQPRRRPLGGLPNEARARHGTAALGAHLRPAAAPGVRDPGRGACRTLSLRRSRADRGPGPAPFFVSSAPVTPRTALPSRRKPAACRPTIDQVRPTSSAPSSATRSARPAPASLR